MVTGEKTLKAITQFLLTLVSANSKYDRVKNNKEAFDTLWHHAKDMHFTNQLGKQVMLSDLKGKISLVAYLVGVVAASWVPWVATATYILVALMWLVPDRRFERVME